MGGKLAKGQEVPFANPQANASERRIQAVVGWPFLWILSFGQTKESISPVGARTDIKLASQRETFKKLKSLSTLNSVV
ncbi:MAG: hypothetical protein ACKN9F_10260 [Methylomonas sp.]